MRNRRKRVGEDGERWGWNQRRRYVRRDEWNWARGEPQRNTFRSTYRRRTPIDETRKDAGTHRYRIRRSNRKYYLSNENFRWGWDEAEAWLKAKRRSYDDVEGEYEFWETRRTSVTRPLHQRNEAEGRARRLYQDIRIRERRGVGP